MKVAYVVGGLPFGGVERSLLNLCREYGKNGLVQTRVFNLSGSGQLIPDYIEAGVDHVSVANNNLRAIVSYRLDTTRRLRKMLREYAPDIIHTMHFTANHHGRMASIGLGVPVVTHLRNVKREKKLLRRLSDKALSYITTRYIAVSKAVAEIIRIDHNLARRPVEVLYNAVTPEQMDFPPVDLKTAYGLERPVVLAVGRYVPQKNLDLLVRAVALLRARKQNVSLMLVGEGTERPRLEALVKELGMEEYVILAGFRDDAPAFYRSADIFAMPSDFEGLPNAHMEAMYFGLPGVVSRHVPSLEIASGASLVCELEAEDIAAKIDLLLSDGVLRNRLSKAAFEVAAGHTMPAYAVSLHQIYCNLAGKS